MLALIAHVHCNSLCDCGFFIRSLELNNDQYFYRSPKGAALESSYQI